MGVFRGPVPNSMANDISRILPHQRTTLFLPVGSLLGLFHDSV
jgi:hypothetical protein